MLLGLTQALGAQTLPALVGAENAAILVRGERITRVQFKNSRAALAPRNEFIQSLTGRIHAELGPSFFVETLVLYSKRGGSAGQSAAAPGGAAVPGGAAGAFEQSAGPKTWTAVERAGLFNQTLALSTLAGLQYYSASRKEWRTFYETSTVVSGGDGKTPRPDPVYAVPPAELTIYARQKDLSFGDNVYRYDYYTRPDLLVFVQENLTAMNYGIIPAVGKNRLRSIVAVFDAGDYLLVYLASMARAASVPGMNEKVSNSFSNRADAILKWFTAQADKVFRKAN
jgi:hypothetical protein